MIVPHDASVQLTEDGKLKHFLTLDGLSKEQITTLLDLADSFINVSKREIKTLPLMRGKTILNLFFENSTRTRTTFEIAGKRLSADVINLESSRMSTTKGESIIDTIKNLEAMHTDMFVIRDSASGSAHLVAQHLPDHISVINAGDGRHAHPTQGMLDMLTIRQHRGDIAGARFAIIGDILHSRVARSQITALKTLGAAEIRVCGPKTLIPTAVESLGVEVYHDLTECLKDIDVVIMLRLQLERMAGHLIPSQQEYYSRFALTQEKLKLAKPDAIVMHPGPMNRGVEISSSVADGPQSVILQQVTNGIAVRMAIMATLSNRG